jgi:transglutaminase-like putative cysteine protease
MRHDSPSAETPVVMEFRVLAPFYLGLAVMVSASIMALMQALSSADFGLRLQAVALAGVAASLVGAGSGRNPSLLGVGVALVIMAMLIVSNAGAEVTELFFPSESLGDHTLLLPTIAAWGIAALSFAQVNRANSIFIFVCGLVVFGLTGTINVNESLLLTFLVFLLGTFFVWGYGSLLAQRERVLALGQPAPGRALRWAHTEVGIGVALTAVVFALSVAAGYPTYRLTPSFFLAPWANRHHPSPFAAVTRNFAGFEHQFTLMGGPIHLSDDPALTVMAEKPALWRCVVYDLYDGHGWSRTGTYSTLMRATSGRRRLELPESAQALRPPGRTEELWQHVRCETPLGPVIAGAAQPTALVLDQPAQAALIDSYGCLRSPAGVEPVISYGVVSTRPVASEAELAAAPTNYGPGIPGTYLGVPAQTRSKLQALADEITAGARNPYEKAAAVQRYLYRHCLYTLQVPPIPPGADAVAYFLQVTKRGACDLYASAFAVLLRLSGVPARVAVGFATGTYDPPERAYKVLQSDAHAWAEVYFPTIGWVEFDPPVQAAPENESWLTRLLQPGWAGPILRSVGRRVALAGLAVLLLHALVVALVGVSPAALAGQWWRRRRPGSNPRQRAAYAYEHVCRALRRHGLVRQPWQTPGEFLWAVRGAASVGYLRSAALERFTSHFERLRYGSAEPAARDVARLELRAGALARRIRRARRTRPHRSP